MTLHNGIAHTLCHAYRLFFKLSKPNSLGIKGVKRNSIMQQLMFRDITHWSTFIREQTYKPESRDFLIALRRRFCWASQSPVMCLLYTKPVYGETNWLSNLGFLKKKKKKKINNYSLPMCYTHRMIPKS